MIGRLIISVVVLLGAPLLGAAQQGAHCNLYASGSAPPEGYGAAWNTLFASKGAWSAVELTGTFVQGSTDWLSGKGSVTAQGHISSDPLYWVGYVCQWTGEWKCGCRDAPCTTDYWQLQASADPFGGTTGGTTGSTTGGAANAEELDRMRQQLHPNDSRMLPYVPLSAPLGSGAGAVNFKPVKQIPLDGDREVNVRGRVLPIDIDGDNEFEYLHFNGSRLMRVYDYSGKKLWQVSDPGGRVHRDIVHKDAISIWDFDGDGGQDIAHCWNDDKSIVIRDGMTGDILTSAALPNSDECKIAAYYMESGTSPIIFAGQRNDSSSECPIGNYGPYLARTIAFDKNLNKLWDKNTCAAGHMTHGLDEDYDGKMEAVFIGKYKMTGSGSVLCTLPFGIDHVDSMNIGDVDSREPGFEIAAAGATGAGLYSARTCNKLWHASGLSNPQNAVLAELDVSKPGLEVVFQEKPNTPNRLIRGYDRDGRLLKSIRTIGTNYGSSLFGSTNIDARGPDELINQQARIENLDTVISDTDWFRNLQRLTSPEKELNSLDHWSAPSVVFDLMGDARKEIVIWGRDKIVIGSQQ